MATQNCSHRWMPRVMKLDLSLQGVKDFNQNSYSFDLKTYVLHYQNTKPNNVMKLN